MDQPVQPWLPKIEKVERVGRERRTPQPRVLRFRSIKRYEILHRPFDLKFRGRLNKWLQRLKENEIPYGKELNPQQDKLVELYLFSQKPKNIWLNQQQVSKRLKPKLKGRLRNNLVSTLLIIWGMAKNEKE